MWTGGSEWMRIQNYCGVVTSGSFSFLDLQWRTPVVSNFMFRCSQTLLLFCCTSFLLFHWSAFVLQADLGPIIWSEFNAQLTAKLEEPKCLCKQTFTSPLNLSDSRSFSSTLKQLRVSAKHCIALQLLLTHRRVYSFHQGSECVSFTWGGTNFGHVSTFE